jgi:hypothetical protein
MYASSKLGGVDVLTSDAGFGGTNGFIQYAGDLAGEIVPVSSQQP